MTAAYEFHPEARLDLREIIDFIGGDNPAAADTLLTKVLDALETPPLRRYVESMGGELKLVSKSQARHPFRSCRCRLSAPSFPPVNGP